MTLSATIDFFVNDSTEPIGAIVLAFLGRNSEAPQKRLGSASEAIESALPMPMFALGIFR